MYQRYGPVILMGILLVLSFLLLRPILVSLFLGAVLAVVTYPLYVRVKTKMRPSLAALLICLLVLVVLVVPGIFLVKGLVQESYALFVLVKQKLAVGLFKNCSNNFCLAIQEFSKNPEVRFQIQEVSRMVTNWIIQKGSRLLVSLPRLLLHIVVTFFTFFYFLRDGKVLLRKVGPYLHLPAGSYHYLLRRLREIVHGLVYGYLLVALIQGAIGALGFFIFGVPSPLFWGMAMAFLALIPLLGTGIIWAPAALILFLNGVFQDSTALILKGIGLFVYGALLIGGLDNLIRPKMIGGKARVHPGVIFVGILGGALVLGPLGVLIGPLVLSLTRVVVELYTHRRSGA